MDLYNDIGFLFPKICIGGIMLRKACRNINNILAEFVGSCKGCGEDINCVDCKILANVQKGIFKKVGWYIRENKKLRKILKARRNGS